MNADRHHVLGARGTAIASRNAVVLVDARPEAPEVARALDVLTGASDLDALTTQLTDQHDSFALAVGVDDGVVVAVRGDATASIADRLVRDEPGGPSSTPAMAATDDSITLSLAGDHAPTGQWLTSGVIIAGAVVVGRLRPRAEPSSPGPAASAAPPPSSVSRRSEPAGRPRPDGPRGGSIPAEDIDFGSLIGTSGSSVSGSAVPVDADVRTDPTAAYVPEPSVEPESPPAPVGELIFSDGQRTTLDAPVVVGRRPPADTVEGSRPHQVTIDDRLLSRRHATFRFVDGRLVVVDHDSTNGTHLVLADGARERCAAGRSIEVPAGATVDIGGVVTVTHERGAREPGPSSC